MSEAGQEFNPNEEEAEETEETSESEETGEQEQPPGDNADKLRKQLKRAQTEAKNRRLELVALKKKMEEGTPDGSEADQLKKDVAALRQEISTSNAVAALLASGYNGDQASARRFLKLADDLSDMDSVIEDLKEDFPERFGKGKQPPGHRPHTGSGRAPSGDGTPKNPDATHVDKLLKMGRPR